MVNPCTSIDKTAYWWVIARVTVRIGHGSLSDICKAMEQAKVRVRRSFGNLPIFWLYRNLVVLYLMKFSLSCLVCVWSTIIQMCTHDELDKSTEICLVILPCFTCRSVRYINGQGISSISCLFSKTEKVLSWVESVTWWAINLLNRFDGTTALKRLFVW